MCAPPVHSVHYSAAESQTVVLSTTGSSDCCGSRIAMVMRTALGSEWAGATFSEDDEWMFINIYNPGITLAITGPWQDGFI